MERDTDQYCNEIFSLLVATRKKIRFNELHKTLNALGAVMSKPTLIQHLHHLQKKGFILRKKEDKQNVTYQVNWKKFEQLEKSLEFKELIAHNLENEKIFKSKSFEDQMYFVIGIMNMVDVIGLKFNVAEIVEPQGKAYASLGYLLIHNLYDSYRRWFLESCRQSKENTQKASELLDETLEHYQKILFERSAKPARGSHELKMARNRHNAFNEQF
jgi:DNA-binding HxlR family transcriptional regulator